MSFKNKILFYRKNILDSDSEDDDDDEETDPTVISKAVMS